MQLIPLNEPLKRKVSGVAKLCTFGGRPVSLGAAKYFWLSSPARVV